MKRKKKRSCAYCGEGDAMTLTDVRQLSLQKRTRFWVESRLGQAAMAIRERGRRSAEENAELVQCCGVTEEEYIAIVKHVYAKPLGVIEQELGGSGMTLLGVAESAGYDLVQCIGKELERVESLPPEKFRKRQAENVANGIGAPPETLRTRSGGGIMAELIRLSLTPAEGLLIGVFLDGAMEQYEVASMEERQDADLQRMYDMCRRIRPFLPRAE